MISSLLSFIFFHLKHEHVILKNIPGTNLLQFWKSLFSKVQCLHFIKGKRNKIYLTIKILINILVHFNYNRLSLKLDRFTKNIFYKKFWYLLKQYRCIVWLFLWNISWRKLIVGVLDGVIIIYLLNKNICSITLY